MLKKAVILLVTVSLFLSLFSGCGKQEQNTAAAATGTKAESSQNVQKNESSNNSNTITGNITYATNRTDIVDTLMRQWADKFQQKYPGVKVEIEGLKDYKKDIQTRIAAGEAPDVYMSQLDYFKKDQWPDYFMPLDDLGIKEDMTNFVEDSSYQGKLYIIPCMMSTIGFVYNKVAFKEAGVTEVPKTFDALMDACKKLKDKGIVPISFVVKGGWTPDAYTNRLTTVLDRNIFNEMEETDEPFKQDNAFGKSMSFMLEFVKRGYVEKDQMSTTWDSFKKDLAQGKTAMGLFGEWLTTQIADNGARPEDVGYFPIPVDNSGKMKTLVRPAIGYAVNSKTKSPEAAKAFVKFMMNDVYGEVLNNQRGFSIIKSKAGIEEAPQIAEFKSFAPEMVEGPQPSDKWKDIANAAQLDFGKLGGDLALSGDFKAIADTYNKSWAEGRKKVNK